jgi:hypothetical protein
MTSNLALKRIRYLATVFLTIGTTAAVAATGWQESTAPGPAGMSFAAATSTSMDGRISTDATPSYPASQAGVRKAAAEGPDALRRYVQRTRMIHNYYYWDFAKQQ